MIRTLGTATLLSLYALGLSACSLLDRSDDAMREASRAAATLQAGALGPAHKHIMAALAITDDNSEFWLLRAQIAAAQNKGQEAYDAYRNVIALDRANAEALRALCQLGGQYGQAADLDRFADQLSLLAPRDNLPITAHGNAALMRGNVAAADRYAEQALAANPGDPNALVLKSQILRRNRKFIEAAELIRRTSTTLGATPAMLDALVQTYRQARDRAGYAQAIGDLARTTPENIDAALQLADLQYQDGDRKSARATVSAIAKRQPQSVDLAARLLELWLKQGSGALTPEEILADSAGASLEMQAAYAQYANELRRPDIAIEIIGKARRMGFSAPTLDSQAALAEALALQGHRATARKIVDAILNVDATHPRGLIARSRLSWAVGDRNTAISDLRQVVAEDGGNATARILLATYLDATGETTLSMSALREGMTADPGSTRLAEALVRMLVARGKKAEAADVLDDVAAAAPLDLHAQRTRTRLCAVTGAASCAGPLRLTTL